MRGINWISRDKASSKIENRMAFAQKMPLVTILAEKGSTDSWETMHLIKEFGKKGIRADVFDCDKDNPKKLVNENKPDAALVRVTMYNEGNVKIVRMLEQAGVPTMNNAFGMERAGNKYLSAKIFVENGLPKRVGDLNYDAVAKKISGHGGEQVFRVKGRYEFEELVAKEGFPLLLQEYMELVGKDIRVFVCGGEVLGAMVRKAPEGEWRTNYSIGGKTEPLKVVDRELKMLALNATRVIGLSIAGVDIAKTEEGQYKLIEINAMPGFKGFTEATGINPAENIVSTFLDVTGIGRRKVFYSYEI